MTRLRCRRSRAPAVRTVREGQAADHAAREKAGPAIRPAVDQDRGVLPEEHAARWVRCQNLLPRSKSASSVPGSIKERSSCRNPKFEVGNATSEPGLCRKAWHGAR